MSEFEKQYYESAEFWEGDKLQDPANQLRIKFTSDYIPSNVTSIADIGCGNGVFVNYLKENKPHLDIVAVDRSLTALKFVKTNKIEAAINDIPLNDISYDCVSCLEVLEHLPVPIYKQSLKELSRISKKYVIISVPFEEEIEANHNQCPSCKTIFNYDLHMRRYDADIIENLMNEFGFRCEKMDKLGEMINFKGHYTFRKIFYKNQFRQWRSPICPVCGYSKRNEEVSSNNVENSSSKPERSLISYFSVLPKLFWPKEKKYYWIIALYKKVK